MPATVNYRELRRRVDLDGLASTTRHLTEALEAKHLKPQDFSIQSLFRALVVDRDSGDTIGQSVLEECFDPHGPKRLLTEAAWAVDSSSFSNITGQLLFSKMLEGYGSPDFVFTPLVPTVTTKLNGEKMPGITEIGDEAEVVDEGHEYPKVGMGEDWLETPPTKKRGMICPITKEAIFFDRTNLLLDRASKIGYWLGVNKEKRIIDCIIDENTTDHRYKWRGNTIATYGDSSGTHSWDNLAASNELVDHTDINAAWLLWSAMTDPWTGEPIEMMGNGLDLVLTPQLMATGWRIINTTEVRIGDGASATIQSVTGNPLKQYPPLTVRSSALLAARLATDTSWFVGDIARAFAYMENWPITTSQAPPNSEAEFYRDIVYQYKASERGQAATIEPRRMVKSTVA